MEKYGWIDTRLGEQEQLVVNMTPKDIERDPDGSYTEPEMDYLDWTFGMTSERFERHFGKMLSMKSKNRKLSNRLKAMGMT